MLGGSLKCLLALLKVEKNSSDKQISVRLLEKALLPVEQLVRQRSLPAAPTTTAVTSSDKEFNLTNFKKIFLQALDNLKKESQS